MRESLNIFSKTDHRIHHNLFREFMENLAIELQGTYKPAAEEGSALKSSVIYKAETGPVEIGVAIDMTELDEYGYTTILMDASDFDESEEDLLQDFLCVVEDVQDSFN